MTNTELYIPTKVKAGTANDNITIAFRAVERWANNLPTGGGGGAYASLTGPGETTTPGDLFQAGGFSASAPTSSPTGIQLNNSSPLGITLADTGGGIELDTHHEIQLNSSTGIQLNPGTTPLGSGFNVEINASQQLNGGTEINGPLQVFDTSASGIGLSEGGTGGVSIGAFDLSSVIALTAPQVQYTFSSGNTGIRLVESTVSGNGQLALSTVGADAFGDLLQIVGHGVTVQTTDVSSTSSQRLVVQGGAIAIASMSASTMDISSVGSMSLQAGNGVELNYNAGGFSPTLGVVIFDANTGAQTNLFVYAGNPNGHVLPGNKGNIVFDISTPGLWLSTGLTSSSWTMYTNP